MLKNNVFNKRKLNDKLTKHLFKPLPYILTGLLSAVFLAGCGNNGGSAVPEEDLVPSKEEKEVELDDEGMIVFNPDEAFTYGSNLSCTFDIPTQQVLFKIDFEAVPESDDDNLYLFEVATYEEEEDLQGKEPVATCAKSHENELSVDYERKYLFARFVPALLYEGEYVPVSYGQYISNPEVLAPNGDDYPDVGSKKGILLDAQTVGTDKLTDLNVKRIAYNIPISDILGESEDPEYPTIEFEYNGKTYNFNGYRIMAYDALFSYLTNEGYYITAIVLNDWNEDYPELIHPLSREKTEDSLYYAFNTEEEEGVRLMEAIALFLAERYSSEEHGIVYDWVIANEINQQTTWNYMATDDLYLYTEAFEKAFRTFYNAIKSRYANARVYFSIDHDWNDNYGHDDVFFNGRDLLYTFNDIALMGGNYDWGLAIHPYPNPLNRVNYWKSEYDMTENAELLTLMNMTSVTDVLTKDEFLDTNGEVRSIAITELGFTSLSGEKLQAAAFAYCYLIVDENPYIDSFMMNRQTDALEEIKTGLALGVYNRDLTPKYIAEVFKNIDTENREDYIPIILNILGANDIEEALSWANP